MKYLNRLLILALGASAVLPLTTLADEQLFGFTRGAELLPKNGNELYQFITLRTGKADGSYYGFDFETELEHGFTDRLQASISLEQHYFNNHGVNGDRDALDDTDSYRFGGVSGSVKYGILSPFKDPLGLAFRFEGGYVWNDEVDGLLEHEYYFTPEIDMQKNFLDDTIICDLDFSFEGAWGKQPAQQYPREMALGGATGVTYRFAPNWFIGVEANVRAEYPMFNFDNFEHVVVYAGPTIHYATKRWWVTLTWTPQVWGSGVDEPNDGKTFAEETSMKIRLKIGLNF